MAHQVSLAWTAPTTRTDGSPISGALTYKVFSNTNLLTATPISTLTYQDTTVVGGGSYVYTVQALEAGGGSSSQSVSVTANIPLANPNVPTGLNITSQN